MTAIKSFLHPSALPGAAFVLAAFTISLFFEGYRDIHYAPAILALLLFASLCIIPAIGRGLEIPVSPAAILLFCLWFYVTLSLSWSYIPFASLVTYLIVIACPLVFFAALLNPDRENQVKTLGLTLFSALVVLATWAIIQILFFSTLYGERAHHPLPNPNNLAGLINLGFLPALALYLSAPFKKTAPYHKWIKGALALLFFAALLATGSRGAILGTFPAVVILIYVLRAPALWKKLAFLLIPAFIILWLVGMSTDLHRLTTIFSFNPDSNGLARFAIWESAGRMFMDHFWFGTGLGTFYLYSPAYRLPGADNSTGNWAHMDPLQYGVEMGIAAPLLFYGFCFVVLLRTIHAVKKTPRQSPERTGIIALFCALFALVLHTHLTFHLYVMPILIVIGVWLALWYHLTAKVLNDRAYAPVTLLHWQKPFMICMTLTFAGFIGFMGITSAMGQYHLLRAQLLIRQGMTEQFITAIDKAEQWAPRSFIDPEVQLAAFYIDLLGKNSAALFTPEEQQSLYIQTIELLYNAEQMNPPWAEIDYKRGLLYNEINPDFEPEAQNLAQQSFENAIKKNPMHFRAREELALLYIKKGLVTRAYSILETGLAYPHNADVRTEYTMIMARIKPLVSLEQTYNKGQDRTP